MPGVTYYRDPNLNFFEIKNCECGLHASRRHTHEEFSLGVVTEGASLFKSTARDFVVEQGSAIVIPPGVIHQCNPKDVNHWQFQMIYLKAGWVRSLLPTIPDDLPISVKQLAEKDYLRLLRLFQRLQENVSELQKESRLIQELKYFCRFEAYFQQKPDFGAVNPQLMKRVKEYLQTNYLDRVTLDDLAGNSGLNKFHLLHCFKEVYHTTPHAFQTMLRINYAKELLQKRPAEPIISIAQDAGFYDQSHFVKAFKQYLGTTPLEYRLGR